MNVNDKTYRECVYDIVRKIPVGKVMTYGQLAIILGEGYTARTVGYVMHGSDEGVPRGSPGAGLDARRRAALLRRPLPLERQGQRACRDDDPRVPARGLTTGALKPRIRLPKDWKVMQVLDLMMDVELVQ